MHKISISLAVGLLLIMLNAQVMAKSTIGGIVFLNTYFDSKDASVTPENHTFNLPLSKANNSRLRIKWSNDGNVSMYYEVALFNHELLNTEILTFMDLK